MAGFKFPADAYVLAVPIAYACFAFSTMVTRTLTIDPEYKAKENANTYYEDERQSTADAQYYDHQLRDLFQERIRNKAFFGVFNNRFGNSPQ